MITIRIDFPRDVPVISLIVFNDPRKKAVSFPDDIFRCVWGLRRDLFITHAIYRKFLRVKEHFGTMEVGEVGWGFAGI